MKARVRSWAAAACAASIRGPSRSIRIASSPTPGSLAGNSIAALDLVVLGRLLDHPAWLERARHSFDYFSRRLAGGGAAGMPQMLVAMGTFDAITRHVVIAGDRDAADTRALIAEFDRRFLPHDRLIVSDPAHAAELAPLVPFAARLPRQGVHATAYVCVDYACRLPVTDPVAFGAQLDERPPFRSAS